MEQRFQHEDFFQVGDMLSPQHLLLVIHLGDSVRMIEKAIMGRNEA